MTTVNHCTFFSVIQVDIIFNVPTDFRYTWVLGLGKANEVFASVTTFKGVPKPSVIQMNNSLMQCF